MRSCSDLSTSGLDVNNFHEFIAGSLTKFVLIRLVKKLVLIKNIVVDSS